MQTLYTSISIDALPSICDNILQHIRPGARVHLHGDLGSGKTTMCQYMIRSLLKNPTHTVRSPTYTYYTQHIADGYSIYHFDLYRLADVHDFFLIGGSDIYADVHTVLFVEWPDRISTHYHSTLDIYISVCADGQGRDIQVVDSIDI